MVVAIPLHRGRVMIRAEREWGRRDLNPAPLRSAEYRNAASRQVAGCAWPSSRTMTTKVTPRQAVEDFNRERKPEVSFSTWRNYQYPLEQFIEFCDDHNIEYINDITGYDLKKFKVRRQQTGIKTVTLKNNLSSIRVFLRWCVQAGLVEPKLPDMVELPTLTSNDTVSDDVLEQDRVESILDYLYKFEYGTLRHVLFQFIWHTGARMGTVQAIDLGDFHEEEQYVELRHRPETGTPLKNGYNGERQVSLSAETAEVLSDHIQVHRTDVVEDSGREPLFTGDERASKTTIRKNLYAVTRPCHISDNCPHGREIAECEATTYSEAGGCPSSMSPHPLRRAAITYHLNRDWPKEKVSERANVSVEVLDEHYDARKESEKRRTRKQYLDNL
jgi:site-specific recombinase XerD